MESSIIKYGYSDNNAQRDEACEVAGAKYIHTLSPINYIVLATPEYWGATNQIAD